MEYKLYPTHDGSAYYYECPNGVKINGVVRETIVVETDDWTCEDGSVEVYPTTEENIAYVSYYGEADCDAGYIYENKVINISEIFNFVNEFADMSPEDIDSLNLRALEA